MSFPLIAFVFTPTPREYVIPSDSHIVLFAPFAPVSPHPHAPFLPDDSHRLIRLGQNNPRTSAPCAIPIPCIFHPRLLHPWRLRHSLARFATSVASIWHQRRLYIFADNQCARTGAALVSAVSSRACTSDAPGSLVLVPILGEALRALLARTWVRKRWWRTRGSEHTAAVVLLHARGAIAASRCISQ